MIRKINLIGVPMQVGVLLFNIDRKKQRTRVCFACRKKGHFRDNCPNMAEPTKWRSKGKALTSVKTWDDSSSKDDPPRTRSHHSSSCSSGHHTNAFWQEVKQVYRPLVMIVMMNVMMRESPPYMNLCMPLSFFRMFALNKRLNLKL
jgi:hypothetical protein